MKNAVRYAAVGWLMQILLFTMGDLMLQCSDLSMAAGFAYGGDIDPPPPNNPPPPPCPPGQTLTPCGCLPPDLHCCIDEEGNKTVSSDSYCCLNTGSGSANSSIHGLEMNFFLGKDQDPKGNAGVLRINGEFPVSEFSKPIGLEVFTAFSKTQPFYDGQVLRQVLAAQTLVDVVTISDYEYQLGSTPSMRSMVSIRVSILWTQMFRPLPRGKL